MKFDEALEGYVLEWDGIRFGWEEEPEGDYETEVTAVAEQYKRHLPGIIEFMLPDLTGMYGDIDVGDVEAHLGTPLIWVRNGTVTYLEQTYDNIHIFSFEYLDDKFEDLQYFCVDG